MDRVRDSYDAVARRYGNELSGELAGKPIDRALYRAFSELVRDATDPPLVGDVGCGPGHVCAFLAGLGLRTIGVDPSPGMIAVARERHAGADFALGHFAELPAGDAAWAGAVAPYSIIHVPPEERPTAWAELARVIRPGGWLLVAFHIETAEQAPGSTRHLTEWWDQPVDLDFHFIDPAQAAVELTAAGFQLMARTDREPWPGRELASRRSYLLAQRV